MSEYLPQDIATKILSRLPPKPLIKFRCVSKSWRQLISSPHFIKLHTQHSTLLLSASAATSPRQFLVRRYSKSLHTEVYSVHIDGDNDDKFPDAGVKIEFPFRDLVRFYYRIVGSYNGVVCLIDGQFGRRRRRRPALEPYDPAQIDATAASVVNRRGFEKAIDRSRIRIRFEKLRSQSRENRLCSN